MGSPHVTLIVMWVLVSHATYCIWWKLHNNHIWPRPMMSTFVVGCPSPQYWLYSDISLRSPTLSFVPFPPRGAQKRRCCLRFGRENIWRQLFAFNCESFQTPRTRLFCFCSYCWCVTKNQWYMHHCMAWSQEARNAQLLEKHIFQLLLWISNKIPLSVQANCGKCYNDRIKIEHKGECKGDSEKKGYL